MMDPTCLPNAIPDEQVVYFLRRHAITLSGMVLGILFLFVAPFGVAYILTAFQPALLADEPFMATLVMGGSLFFLFAWLFLFQNFVDFFLDIWIVTDRRILNIEQTGLFGRTVSELRLNRIQDVTAKVEGILHTMLDFGNVEIQTAGEKVHFLFEQVPHPNAVAKRIMELSEADRLRHIDDAVEEFAMPQTPHHHVTSVN